MAGGNTSTAHVVITMDGQQALHMMEVMKAQAQKLRGELQAMESAGQTNTDDYEKKVNELKAVENAVRQNARAYLDIDKIVKNLNNTSLRTLRQAMKELKKQMDALDPEVLARQGKNYRQELARLQAQYQAIDNQIGRVTGEWKRQDGAIMSVIKRLTAYVSVYGGFNLIKNKLTGVFTSNLEFSDQLADIRKATGLSTETVTKLSDEIMKIDTRSAVSELHNLAFEAGRLGIGNQGADAVLGFVRAADKLNVALKEDLGDDAIIQLTKLADVMGLTKSLGVEKSLLSIGSAINELAQNSTANGKFLTDYASRLSGIATQAHLTVDQLLGLAAASDATGQEVEVSATAMNKFVVQLQTHYKTVAAAAGVSEEKLHQMLEAGETAQAVVMVLEELGKKGGLSMLAPLMKDMGSDGARLTASLATMASNIDLVKEQLQIAKEAFNENISVINEFNIRNESAAAIMERMKNSWDKLFTNSANVGAVRELAQDFYDLSESLRNNSFFLGTLNVALKALIVVIKILVEMLPVLTIMFSVKGIILFANYIKTSAIPALRSLAAAFTISSTAANSAAAATSRAAAVLKGLTSLLKSNVFILVASAIGAIATQLVRISKEVSLADENLRSFNDGVKKFESTSHSASIEANILFSRLQNASKGSKERRDLIKQINEQYGRYLPHLINEKSSLEEIATAQETVNTKLRQSLALKAKNAAMDEAGQTFTPKMAEATSRIQEIYTAGGVGKVGEGDIQYLIAQTQKYYDAGVAYEEIKEKVWKELYAKDIQLGGEKGRSVDLVSSGGVLSGDWRSLQNAVFKYINNFWNQQVAVQRASQKYDPLIGDYKETVESDAPYAIVETEKESEIAKRNRLLLKGAKDEYQAVMAAIEVYYKQQEQVVNDAYMKRKITITQREKELADIEDRFIASRISARAALHNDPGAEEDWTFELVKMTDENLSHTENTNRALQNLMSKDLKAIGDKLRKFGEGENDGIWKQLESDRAKLQENAIKTQQEIETIIRKYDFTGQVTEKFMAAMQKLDLLFIPLKERMGEDLKDARKTMEAEMQGFYDVYPQLFGLDINTEEGLSSFRELLNGAKDISEHVLGLADEDMRLLYYKVLEYGDAMTEAENKAKERQLKIAQIQYERTPQYEANKNRMKTEEKATDVYKMTEQLGLVSDIMVQDQEVKLYEARLKAAQDYYEYLKSTGRDTQEAELKMQEATSELAAAMVSKVKEQLDVLRSYGKNLEDFGTDFGNAVFGDLEERQDALESFIRAIGKSTQELIMNWVKQQIEHAIVRKAMVKVEEDAQAKMADAAEVGKDAEVKSIEESGKDVLKGMVRAAAKRLRFKRSEKKEETEVEKQGQDAQGVIVESGQEAITQAVVAMGQQAVAAKKSQAAENVSTEAAETTANASMGIASGAAKTIGELGWWGIPLVAVITALINSLLSMAMSKVGSLFGGSDQGANVSQRLVTGMLTYDEGNVQQVLGSDGNVYSARIGGISGSGIVSVPTLTNVGGQTALVGEKGPEIVIGRVTTKALMENRPDLLAGLISFDRLYSGRRFRTYAGGNLQQFTDGSNMGSPQEAQDAEIASRVMESLTATLTPILEGVNAALSDNARTNAALRERLNQPIQASINKFGRGGLVDEVATGFEQEKQRGRNDVVRRLFSGK